jgi:hypothetical protein
MKTTKAKKGKRKEENPEDVFERMLESYTVVPPSSYVLKRMRRSDKKHKKVSLRNDKADNEAKR